MIEQTTIDGRPCTVAYITRGFSPATPDTCEMVKIIFHDGEIAFAVPADDPHTFSTATNADEPVTRDYNPDPDWIKGKGGRFAGSRPRGGGRREEELIPRPLVEQMIAEISPSRQEPRTQEEYERAHAARLEEVRQRELQPRQQGFQVLRARERARTLMEGGVGPQRAHEMAIEEEMEAQAQERRIAAEHAAMVNEAELRRQLLYPQGGLQKTMGLKGGEYLGSDPRYQPGLPLHGGVYRGPARPTAEEQAEEQRWRPPYVGDPRSPGFVERRAAEMAETERSIRATESRISPEREAAIVENVHRITAMREERAAHAERMEREEREREEEEPEEAPLASKAGLSEGEWTYGRSSFGKTWMLHGRIAKPDFKQLPEDIAHDDISDVSDDDKLRIASAMAYQAQQQYPAADIKLRLGSSGLTVLANQGGFSMTRHLHFGEGRVDNAYLTIPKGDQGTGVAKRIIGDQFETYWRTGFERVDVHANIDVGAYSWAKYGFLPDENSWRHLHRQMVSEIANILDFHEKGELKLDTVKGEGEGVGLGRLRELHDQLVDEPDNTRGLWDIADSPVTVNTQGDELADIVIASALSKPLGKYLLPGADWMGDFDLNDDDQVERFKAYVASKKK